MDSHKDRTDLEKESCKKTSLVETCDVVNGVVAGRDDRDAVNVPFDIENRKKEKEILTQYLLILARKHDVVYNGEVHDLIGQLLENNHITKQQYEEMDEILNIN